MRKKSEKGNFPKIQKTKKLNFPKKNQQTFQQQKILKKKQFLKTKSELFSKIKFSKMNRQKCQKQKSKRKFHTKIPKTNF